MSDYRILCTGGAGYVGSACLRYLLRNGYEAFAFDNLSCGNRLAVPDADNRLVVGDINDREAILSTLRELNVNAVMHFAAVASVPESISQPDSYWEVNVLGTKNLRAMIWLFIFQKSRRSSLFIEIISKPKQHWTLT